MSPILENKVSKSGVIKSEFVVLNHYCCRKGLEEGFWQLRKLKNYNFDGFFEIVTKGSFLSTTINWNLKWTLTLEVHGNDSFSNLRFHFDLHMCHSLSIKKALLYRKVCNKTCCSPSPITFFSPIYKTISFWSFFFIRKQKSCQKKIW